MKSVVARGLTRSGGVLTWLGHTLERHDRTLAGDRDLEWGWCAAHLLTTPGRVLDVGAGTGPLSAVAAFRGHEVVAVDLLPSQFAFVDDRVEYRQGDVIAMDLAPGSFDQIVNCSTTEHVGLSGRYGAQADSDGDLRAMDRLAELLAPGGTMLLTLPVGRDAVFPPWHRVYGAERLPRLLARFDVVVEEFRAKPSGARWERVDRETALGVEGSATFYALGLFVLRTG